jgi:Ca2+:H+ antiporter
MGPAMSVFSSLERVVRAESAFLFGALTTVLLYAFPGILPGAPGADARTAALFLWVFAAMLWCAFSVVRHAECLADLLGEPYGTLIETLSVVSIEVSVIAAIMIAGENEPTLARDTMFAVLMIVLNGAVGLALLLGALRHREQHYNLQGAKAYLAVIIPVAGLTLVLPTFTRSTATPTFTPLQAAFFAASTMVLYGVFLLIQTVRHTRHFVQPGAGARVAGASDPLAHDESGREAGRHAVRSAPYHTAFLFLTLVPVVLLAKKLATFVDYLIETLGAPVALGAMIVAVLVLSPEGVGALRAALQNELQRAVNNLLGLALATIGLIVPAVLAIGFGTGRSVELGLGQVEMVLLILTLTVCSLTFSGGRTNVLQGAVHLALFLSYVVLIFNP